MNTKFQIVSVAVGLLGAATNSYGGFPVSIVASAPDATQWAVEGKRWGDTTAQWTKEINKLNEQIQEVKNVYEQAQVISAFVGDPKAALQDLNQIQAICGNFSEIGGEGTSFGSSMNSLGDLGAAGGELFRAGSGLNNTISEFDSMGKPRNVSLYQASAATARLADKTRSQLNKSQKDMERSDKRMDAALDRLAARGDEAGATDIATAQLAVQREAAAQQSQYYRAQLLRQQQEEESRRLAAEEKARVTAASEDADRLAETSVANLDKQRQASLKKIADTYEEPKDEAPTNANLKLWTNPD